MAEYTVETKDDYTGQGGVDMEYIENEDQLAQLMADDDDKGGGADDDKEPAKPAAKPADKSDISNFDLGEFEDDDPDDDKNKNKDKDKSKTPAGDASKKTDTEDDDDGINIGDENNDSQDDTKQYDSVVHYLDDKFKLNMNLDTLPKDMDSKTANQIVGDIFSRLQDGLRVKLGEYEDVRTVLQDQEVKDFILAKQQGKTLKDFVQDFSGSTEGMTDEQVVREELKHNTPNATKEDIDELIEGYKTSKTLEKTANIMRAARKDREEKAETAAQAKADNDARLAEQQRDAEVANYNKYLGTVKTVYGIPLTDEMRKQVFAASTQQDANGLTYLDKALQSDEGVLLATLGILHMKQLISASSSTTKNRARKEITEKLFATPEQLQSGDSDGNRQTSSEEDEIAAINSM